MTLSLRLEAVKNLLLPGNMLADIGCDHGYLCIDAVRSGLFPSAIAADIRSGPLKKAEENISSYGLSDRIGSKLSDGFSSLDPVFDCAVICGMGGLLIRDILQQGDSKLLTVKQLVLGPHSESDELRKWLLFESGFGICRESAVEDSGQFYTLLDVRPASSLGCNIIEICRKPLFLKFGYPGIQTDLSVYKKYLDFRKGKLLQAVHKIDCSGSVLSAKKKDELQSEADEIDLILNKYLE